jgi:hypothetical protein
VVLDKSQQLFLIREVSAQVQPDGFSVVMFQAVMAVLYGETPRHRRKSSRRGRLSLSPNSDTEIQAR